VRGLGQAGGRCARVGAVWRAKRKTDPYGLGFGGTWMGALDKGSGGLCVAGDGRVRALGGLEAGVRKTGWFGARKRKPSPVGSVLLELPNGFTRGW